MIIRDYRPEDYGQVWALWQESGLPAKCHGRDTPHQLIRQIAGGTVFILVAEMEGAVVGTVVGSHDGRKGWLNRLAVAAAWRGAPVGVAARLVQEAERRFRALGLEIFCCLIEADNLPSARFMSRMGYERFGHIQYFAKKLRPDV